MPALHTMLGEKTRVLVLSYSAHCSVSTEMFTSRDSWKKLLVTVCLIGSNSGGFVLNISLLGLPSTGKSEDLSENLRYDCNAKT